MVKCLSCFAILDAAVINRRILNKKEANSKDKAEFKNKTNTFVPKALPLLLPRRERDSRRTCRISHNTQSAGASAEQNHKHRFSSLWGEKEGFKERVGRPTETFPDRVNATFAALFPEGEHGGLSTWRWTRTTPSPAESSSTTVKGNGGGDGLTWLAVTVNLRDKFGSLVSRDVTLHALE